MKKAIMGICLSCILLVFGGVFSYAADTELEVEEFTSGVFVEEVNDRVIVKIDRKQLPESMKSFTKISVMGSGAKLTKELARDVIQSIIDNGYGLTEYDDERGCNSGKYENTLVSIYDNDVKPLGYYILRGDEPICSIILGADEFTSGVSTEEELKKRIVKVNREQLPESMKNFVKMSVSGSNRELTKEHIRGIMENILEYGFGLIEYNDENGYGSGIYENTLISIYDKDNKPLGYYIVKGNEIIVTVELKEFTKGVTLQEANDRVIVKVDRTQLPESMKNFTKMSVSGSNTEWTNDLIRGIIQNVLDYGYGLTTYDDVNGYNSGKYKYTMVSIYDNDNKLLGYYIVNGKETIPPLEVEEFISGVFVNQENDRVIVKVDRAQLPESMKNFTKMSVTGSDTVWTKEQIKGVIQNTIDHGYGLMEYDDERGYNSGKYKNTMVSIYDNNVKPLGYYILKGDEASSSIILGADKFTSGVSIEEELKKRIVKVNREQLPESMKNFVKMSVSGSNREWTMNDIRGVIENILEYGYGLNDYDDQNGYHSSIYEYTMISIYDKDNKLLGYYVVKGNEITVTAELKEFTSGVTMEDVNDYVVVKVDREQLPESMKNFTKMSVAGSGTEWTTHLIKGVIQETIDYGYGLKVYDDEKGYNSSKYDYTLISIHDNNNKILGYYIVK